MTQPAPAYVNPIERRSDDTTLKSREESQEVAGSIQKLLVGILFIATLSFGAVHQLPSDLFLCSLTLLALYAQYSLHDKTLAWSRSLLNNKLTFLFIFSLALFGGYATLQYFLLNFSPIQIPILGSSYQVVSIENLQNTLVSLGIVAVVLYLVSLSCFLRGTSFHLSELVQLLGIVVALTALIHWFSDNGKLFWTFEPNYVASSPRARWPFVNPNHLGFFLIAPFFLAVGRMLHDYRSFTYELRKSLRDTKSLHLAHAITQHHHQKRLIRLTIAGLSTIVIAVALLATQSFGAFTATLFGLLSFWFLACYRFPPSHLGSDPKQSTTGDTISDQVIDLDLTRSSEKRPRRRRKKKQWEKFTGFLRSFAKKLISFTPLFVVLLLGGLLLSERAGELIQARLEYKLLSAHEDMRRQLYLDSSELLKEAPLLGIGAGNWADEYFRVMDPGLAGINPVYLHSDPFQHLIEYGALGTLPFVLAFVLVLVIGLAQSPLKTRIHSRTTLRSAGLLSAFLALSVANVTGFQMRIPANLVLYAVIVGLIVGQLLATQSKRRSTHHNNLS